MKDFKLIAIRPLAGCNKKFTKILKEGTPYVFYNEYDFSKYGDNSKSITIKTDLIPDLYSFENNSGQDIKISISAIVGENGSGKSSIVELFYVACYNISVIKKVLFDEETEKPVALKNIVSDIKIEIFYKIDNDIYLLSLVGTKIKIFKLTDKSFKNANDIAFDLNNFFYTISINYSLHSLNSNVFGDWINRIFHKNDGYQTPIVLNPFRNKGNIEINNEEYLVKSRMISNILGKIDTRTKPSDSLRNVLDKKVAYKLKVELNREKFNYKAGEPIFENIEEIGEKILPLVYKYFLNDYNFIPKDTPLNKYAKEYILSKVKSIANKYQPYKRFSTFLDKNISTADEYLSILSQDNSHVTFKLKQAINFLSNELYYDRKETFDLTVAYLSKQLNKESEAKGKELIDILPPAFFKVDIEFRDGETFNLLSSGEKQRVYSIATLIYHLNNLASVSSNPPIYKYRRVNIIFDELELYFHPELQRNLINDIIESIKKIDLKDIDAINILLITHSPFILSDIPDPNILFLDVNGLPLQDRENIKTFGGNIHELLAHGFFLNNGFIGQFAKNKIQNIIDFLTPSSKAKQSKINLDKDITFREIQIIGEPFLKEKLTEMYFSKFDKFDKDKRIAELERELEKLKK